MDDEQPSTSGIQNAPLGTHWSPMGAANTFDNRSTSTVSADDGQQAGPSRFPATWTHNRRRSSSNSSTFSARVDVDNDGRLLVFDAAGVVHRDGYEAYLREGAHLFSTRNVLCFNLPMLHRTLSAEWLRRKIRQIIGNRARSYYILAGFVITVDGQPEAVFFPSQNTCIYRSFNKFPNDHELRRGVNAVVRRLLSRSSGIDAILLNLQIMTNK